MRLFFLNDRLKVNPLTGAFVVSDWDDIPDNYVLIYMPSLTFIPVTNAEISLGVRLIWGKGDNAFSNVTDKDEVVFTVGYMF